jgi:hypothetical protein
VNSDASRPWLFCQIGAREHYVLAREFHRRGLLRGLITDAWAPPQSLAARLPGRFGRRLAERYAADLADASVVRFTGGLLVFELLQRLRGRTGWNLVGARNHWFEAQAVRALRDGDLLAGRPTVFAYSYAARDIFRAARAAGCTTVLGQIDPAITEEDIVAEAVARHPELAPGWQRAPQSYWQRWREECALADRIVVNSEWAREGLVRAGIAADKLRIVPLAYPSADAPSPRAWPPAFDDARPLRLLFLGSFILRKGAAELLEAARLLRDKPVEFHVVGASDLHVPDAVHANPRFAFHGPVPRNQVHAHFASADLFVLPTLSDGFGLTLLEAQAHGLPVIASRRCGDVVRAGVDGTVLEHVTGAALAAAVEDYLVDPTALSRQGGQARTSLARFTPDRIVDQLLALS